MAFETDVVIVGAGAAGLSAARLLSHHRLRCLLLEGAELIGGRLRTVRRRGWQMPIELGAEFVHGRPAPTRALSGGSIELVKVPERRVQAGTKLELMQQTWQRLALALEPALQAPPRQSVADYLAEARLAPELDELVRMIVEGYHAAPLDDVSARAVAQDAARSAGGLDQYRTAHGYDQVLTSLEQGLDGDATRIELGQKVTRVTWARGRVEVETTGRGGGSRVSARRCLITASLGVLQAPPRDGGIVFEPEPASFRPRLSGLGMGSVARVVMRFAHAPWVPGPPGLEAVFAHIAGAPFPTLWREARAGEVQITAWSGGPAAQQLLRSEPSQLVDEALASLARAANVSLLDCQRSLLEAHYHDFNRDPLIRGAYSYVRPGGEEAAQQLAEPWEDTLYFAGEALDLQYPGTVAGALGSGEHVARRILAAWSE